MNISPTGIPGVHRVELDTHEDARGAFTRWYCDREMESLMDGKTIVQANHSLTRQTGAIRGMHYQLDPHRETKIIRCIRGRVFDVAVDLRADSPTLLQWHGEELQGDDNKLLVIPEGCAHGFQVIEAPAELLYLHSAHYAPDYEGGIRFDDPRVGIQWPLAPGDISERDQSHPLLSSTFNGL